MKKKSFLILSFVFEGLVFITFVLLAFLVNLPIWLSLMVIMADLLLVALSVMLLVKIIKKQKKLSLQSKSVKLTGDLNFDIYAILGIPIQYNPDGSIKSIFELLKLNPIYDETGERILTPYELLGMLPKFDKNGNEIPLVFVIKNRVGKVAKVDLNKRVLTRKLSEQEQEERLIEEMLRRKLEEAQQSGNKVAAAKIAKVIQQENKKKTAKQKQVKYTIDNKLSKKKVEPQPKVKAIDNSAFIKAIFGPKNAPEKKPEKKPEPTATPAQQPEKKQENKAVRLNLVNGMGRASGTQVNNLSNKTRLNGMAKDIGLQGQEINAEHSRQI